MNENDPIIWLDRSAGEERPGKYLSTHGGYYVIQTVTPTGHLGLRYVDPKDVRPTGGSAP